MKESIGITQLFIIVVTLIIIFSSIMAMAINRSNSFAIKDKLVNVIEKHGGFNMDAELIGGSSDEALQEMVDSLLETSYRQKGKCPETTVSDSEWITVSGYERNGTKTVGTNESSFCIVKYKGNNNDGEFDDGALNVYYYKVIVFYHLDIPVLRSLFSFKVTGETKALYS